VFDVKFSSVSLKKSSLITVKITVSYMHMEKENELLYKLPPYVSSYNLKPKHEYLKNVCFNFIFLFHLPSVCQLQDNGLRKVNLWESSLY
jgi:hypothetical protein